MQELLNQVYLSLLKTKKVIVTNQHKSPSIVEESNSFYYKNYSTYYSDNNEEIDLDTDLDLDTDPKLILKIKLFKDKILDFLNKAFNWIDK